MAVAFPDDDLRNIFVDEQTGTTEWHIPSDVLELFPVESDGSPNIMSVRGYLSGRSMKFTEKGMQNLKKAFGDKLVSEQTKWGPEYRIKRNDQDKVKYSLVQVDSSREPTNIGVWMTFRPVSRWKGPPGSYNEFVRSVIAKIVEVRKEQRAVEKQGAVEVATLWKPGERKGLPFGMSAKLAEFSKKPKPGGRKRTRRHKKRRMTRRH